jgi:orotate phosphoribosyltransferase
VNCLSVQGPSCPLGHLLLAESVAIAMKRLCEVEGPPIIFDFSGISISNSRAFEVFREESVGRPVLFINVNDVCLARLRDDSVPLEDEVVDQAIGIRNFWVGAHRDVALPAGLGEINGRYIRHFLMSKQGALTEGGLLLSTPVLATKYYDVRRLCIEQNTLQVIATGIGTAVLKAGIDFDVVVASSHTGSLVAAPVSILLGKRLHCWTDLGPSFRPKRRMDWAEGKGKRCVLVADVICMGTEAHRAQAFLAASGNKLVGCAAVAIYLPPNNVRSLTLLDRSDLEQMGYRLSIPPMGVGT